MSGKSRLILLAIALLFLAAGMLLNESPTLSNILVGVGIISLILLMIKGGGC